MRIWLCLFLTASLLAGCGTTSKKASPPKNQTESTPKAQSVKENKNIGKLSKGQQISKQDHLEELVKHVPGVKDVHCVVLGNTAIVAIDVDSKLERARVGSIKYTVAETLRKDPQGVGAIVTADLDLSQRLKEIGEKVKEGRPISGFATELADMIGRIVPQLPRDTGIKGTSNQKQPKTIEHKAPGAPHVNNKTQHNRHEKTNLIPHGKQY